MFRDYIDQPIDPIPKDYADSLKKLLNEPDYSLTCLGIALLRPRIENYQGIIGKYLSFQRESSAVSDYLNYDTTILDYPSFCYYIYSHTSDENPELIKTALEERGYQIKESIGLLLKNKANVKCTAAFHSDINAAVVFIDSPDMRYYHLVISFLPVLFPSLFKDRPMTESDYNLIKALSKPERDVFIQRIQESMEPYTMEFRRMMLGSLLETMHKTRITQAENDVRMFRNTVDDLERRYAQAIRDLKQQIIQLEGLKIVEQYDEAEQELVEYMTKTKELRNMTISNNRLRFTVATLLNNYNENAWETFAKRGYIFDGNYKTALLPVFEDKENRKLLLNNLFSDRPDFQIKIAGNYTINLNDCRVSTDSEFNYEKADPIYKSYLPNPHLKIFSCLGGYRERIPAELLNRNYIGAIELCIASAGSVDLDETEQTFRPFLGWILASRNKILKRRDGTDMTPEEALIWLIDKEKENETT